MELSFDKFQVICIKMTRDFVTTFSVALIFQDRNKLVANAWDLAQPVIISGLGW